MTWPKLHGKLVLELGLQHSIPESQAFSFLTCSFVTELSLSCSSLKNPILRDKCWLKGKMALLRELAILGRRWTHIPKNQLPPSPGFVRKLYREKRKGLHVEERVAGCMISSDELVVRQPGVNIINLLVSTSLGSMCLWAAYSYLIPPGGGFSICKTAQTTWLRILSIALEEEPKVLDFV